MLDAPHNPRLITVLLLKTTGKKGIIIYTAQLSVRKGLFNIYGRSLWCLLFLTVRGKAVLLSFSATEKSKDGVL